MQTITPIEDDAEYDDELVQKLFAELDTDGNGSIDYDELKRGLRKQRRPEEPHEHPG